MKKQLTLDDIVKLRSSYKDDFVLQGLLSALEPRVADGEEIIWHNPPIDPIPSRPWAIQSRKIIGCNGRHVADISAFKPESPLIAQFIVDRVNAGEHHKSIECLNTPEESALAERVECNRPDCNSLLIHRLHHVKQWFRPHCCPYPPATRQNLTATHVIATLCNIASIVNDNIFHWTEPSDCFCGQIPAKPEDFRFDSAVLQFINDAVQEKIDREKAKASSDLH